jgi:hypothetical protein
MTRTITLLSAVGCVILISACTHPQAKTAPDGPALDMPAPPPRDVEPTDTEVPAPMPLPEEPAHRPPARPRPAPPSSQPKTDSSKPEPAKPEVPVVEPSKPADEPKPPAPPPTTLQTTPPDEEGAVEQSIRGSLVRARTDLNRIDYRVLNTDARTQYDTAKRWVEQAEEAIRAKNLVFAKTLAENAATLAARLARK